jgi:hypothetical protein
MAKPSVQLVLKDTVGSASAYIVIQAVQRVAKPDPESWTDEMAMAVVPVAISLFIPQKWSRQAAAAGGAAMYPLLTRLAVQLGIV